MPLSYSIEASYIRFTVNGHFTEDVEEEITQIAVQEIYEQSLEGILINFSAVTKFEIKKVTQIHKVVNELLELYPIGLRLAIVSSNKIHNPIINVLFKSIDFNSVLKAKVFSSDQSAVEWLRGDNAE